MAVVSTPDGVDQRRSANRPQTHRAVNRSIARRLSRPLRLRCLASCGHTVEATATIQSSVSRCRARTKAGPWTLWRFPFLVTSLFPASAASRPFWPPGRVDSNRYRGDNVSVDDSGDGMTTNTNSRGTKVVLLAVHGMGETKQNFARRLHVELRERLRGAAANVHFDAIYYQDVFQQNQSDLWKRLPVGQLDWLKVRRLFLYGFSDAAGYERKPDKSGSAYEQVQTKIRAKLKFICDSFSNLPIVLVAQSLGGHVISNYIWDAQQTIASCGVWSNKELIEVSQQEEDFLRLRTLRLLYTTGCNIPIFLGSLPKADIVAVDAKGSGYNFDWKNYYDEDDPLGWPLKQLSDTYKNAVLVDKRVNVGGLLSSWNPASHTRYWTDRDVLKPLADDIRALLKNA